MARTLHADLLAVQSTNIQPAIQLIFKNRSGATVKDLSFDPTVTTNALESLEHHEEPYGIIIGNNDATIIFNNNTLGLLDDLTGYYVDIGYGANTASGLRYSTAQRLWVKEQDIIDAPNRLAVRLYFTDVWNMMLEQKVLIGNAPYYQDEAGVLIGMTVYGIIEYLIETALTNATGYTFTLDALGTQDDGIINTYVPAHLDADGNVVNSVLINPKSPGTYDNYAKLISDLLTYTKCYLRAEAGGAFKIIYPQSSDAVDEQYYSSLASGHVFYENNNVLKPLIPNHIIVYGAPDNTTTPPTWAIVGHAYDSDSFSSPPTYDGPYVEVKDIYYVESITVQADANNYAAAILSKFKAETRGGRIVTPHDARVELYDKPQVSSTRGLP